MIAFRVDVRRADPGDGHEGHQGPIAEQTEHGPYLQHPFATVDKHQRHHEVADRNALQHTGNAPGFQQALERARSEETKGITGQEKTESEKDGGPLDRLDDNLPLVDAGLQSPAQGQDDGHADDEEKEREDEVRRRPAVPLRVQQRPVDVPPSPQGC